MMFFFSFLLSNLHLQRVPVIRHSHTSPDTSSDDDDPQGCRPVSRVFVLMESVSA